MVATIGKPAPDFTATAIVDGDIKTVSLSDYKGKYVVLFFYPLDFTFVCPTEIIAFSDRIQEFKDIGVEVLGASVDSAFAHLAWIQTPRSKGGLGGLSYPLLADLTKSISKDYEVLIEEGWGGAPGRRAGAGPGPGLAFWCVRRATGGGRHVCAGLERGALAQRARVNDLPVGRSVDETLRLLKAFQFTDKHGEVCPANWTPGADTIKPNPKDSLEYFSKHSSPHRRLPDALLPALRPWGLRLSLEQLVGCINAADTCQLESVRDAAQCSLVRRLLALVLSCQLGREPLAALLGAVATGMKRAGYFDFSVPNFSGQQGAGGEFASPRFFVGGAEWQVRLYPLGSQEGEGTHLSLYLYCLGSDAALPLTVQSTVTVFGADESQDLVVASSSDTVAKAGDNWGWHTFVPLERRTDTSTTMCCGSPQGGAVIGDCDEHAMDACLAKLQALNIQHELHQHSTPVMTVEAQDKRGRLYIVTALADTKVDLKTLSARLGVGKGGIRLAPDGLVGEVLGVPLGSVTPLAVGQPGAGDVVLFLDQKLRSQGRLFVHPCDNRATAALAPAGLEAFLESLGREAVYVDLEVEAVIDKDNPPDLKQHAERFGAPAAAPAGDAAAAAVSGGGAAPAAAKPAKQAAGGGKKGGKVAAAAAPSVPRVDVHTTAEEVLGKALAVLCGSEGAATVDPNVLRRLRADVEAELVTLRNAAYAGGFAAAQGGILAAVSREFA
eukprot:scaffold4.g4889.t1